MESAGYLSGYLAVWQKLKKEPDTPFSEFIMAIAGPIASFILAAIFGIVWFFTRDFAPVGEPAAYLARINVILGIFNLLPGYPLDGGRVLRSIIWKATGNLKRSTLIASTTGRVFGFVFIAIGIVFIFTGNFLNGVWFALIGWFLQSAAYMSYRQLVFEVSVKGVKVKDVMNEDLVTVVREVSLQGLVDDYFMKYRFSRFPVITNIHSQKAVGVISIHDIKAFPREQWHSITIGQVVKSLTENEIIPEEMEISDAIKQMTKFNLGHLVIMSGNRIKGMLTKTDVMNYIQFYTELH